MIAVLRCVAPALLLGGALAGCSATNPNILSHYDAGSSAPSSGGSGPNPFGNLK